MLVVPFGLRDAPIGGVLSLAKLGPGGAGYYLDTVASGAEEYYMGTGEAPGAWFGSASG